MQIEWKGANKVEIKTKAATITTSEKIKINEIELPGQGEYEIAGVEVFAIANDVYVFKIEDINVGYFDGLNRALSTDEIKELSDISIAIIPVGGKGTIDENKAADVIKAIEPSVVVPIESDSFDKFCKLIGKCQEPIDSYKITKQQLVLMEGVTTVILNP